VRGLIDFIFPPNCAGCDRPATLLCPSCAERVPRIDPHRACPRCGAPSTGKCRECGGRTFAFSAARCAALLEPPVSRAIVLLKDGGERRYAEPLAALLVGAAQDWLGPDDVIVPVPASPAAVRRRGFDHAADLARALARATGNRLALPLLAQRSADQRVLTREERFANRSDAFRIAPGAELPARLVLVDDVFTTGATLDAAARLLRSAGAIEVRALTVARACSPPPSAVNNGAPPATLLMLSPGSVVADASAS
jgi:ComF family protein